MGGLVLFVVILVFVLLANLGKNAGASGASRRRRMRAQAASGLQGARQQVRAFRQLQRSDGGASWPAPTVSPPTATTRQPGWLSPSPGPSPYAGPPPQQGSWDKAWAPTDVAPEVAALQAVQAVATDPEPAGRASSPDTTTSTALSAPPTERYIGSAALESTLDSTIESSLLGIPAGPISLSVMPSGTTIGLPESVEARVVAFMADGHEVAAVRLICDEMECGLLDAMRTVRSYT